MHMIVSRFWWWMNSDCSIRIVWSSARTTGYSPSDNYQDTQNCVVQPKKSWVRTTRVSIKTHGMCRATQEALGAHNRSEYINRSKKKRFSRIHRSVIFYSKLTKFAVKVVAYKGRLDTKFEVNCVRRFRDMRDQNSSFFIVLQFFFFFAQITNLALTRKHVFWSSWNLVHL